MSAAAGPVRRQLEFLINGFDFYGRKDRLREDDRLVRERAGHSLTDALAALRRTEDELRRRLPAPTRDQPLPPADALARVRDLGDLGRDVGDLEGRLRALPYPHTDRTWSRLRTEAVALEFLLECDLGMVAGADAVRDAARAVGPEPDGAALQAVRGALQRCEDALRSRAEALQMPGG